MSRLRVVVVLVCLACAAAASADVTPLDPGAFGASATVETFEGVAGVQLPLVVPIPGLHYPWSVLPTSYAFATGATFETTGTETRLFDFSQIDPNNALGRTWGLGASGGELHSLSPLPSGAAFVGVFGGNRPTSPIPELRFVFSNPVNAIGAYVEAFRDDSQAGLDGVVQLEAFDALGQPLGSLSVTTDGATVATAGPPYDGLNTWIGLGTAGGDYAIHSVVFRGRMLVLDDLNFAAVPEPASALLLVAVAGLMHCRRGSRA